MRAHALLVGVLLLGACTRRATEIKVRDPGVVAVSAGSSAGWAPVLPPDRYERTARISEDGSVSRASRRLTVSWASTERKRDLIDGEGRFARIKSSADIRSSGGLLYVPYAVSPRGVYAYEELGRRPEATPVLLTTPTHNLEYARYEEGMHKWPGYVMLPIGAVLSAMGIAVMASAEGEYEGLERVAGGFLLVTGAPLLGVGIYFAASSPEITPLAPGVSTGVE